jgi:hypothetical protein
MSHSVTPTELARTLQRAKTLLMVWRSITLNPHSQPIFTQQRHHTAHCTVAGRAPRPAPQHERCEQARILRRWAGVRACATKLQLLANGMEMDFFPLLFDLLHVNTRAASAWWRSLPALPRCSTCGPRAWPGLASSCRAPPAPPPCATDSTSSSAHRGAPTPHRAVHRSWRRGTVHTST